MIVGITGTLGAGKGTVVEYLVSKYAFEHYSARTLIEEEVQKRGLELSRDSTTLVANDLREKFGANVIAERLYEKALAGGSNAVIESLRAPAEVDYLRSRGKFQLWAIDADPKRRYGWIAGRGSYTDNVTFEKFLADEAREMHSEDPTKQNIGACIKLADQVFYNNGTREDLWAQVDKALEGLAQ